MFEPGNKHGRGGRREGAGRKPSAIRQVCAESFGERVSILQRIADDEARPPRDRIAALGLLARYGVGHADQLDTDGAVVVVRMSPELERWAQ